MSTIRVRSPASYWLAVPAAVWMLGVVVVPIVLLVWVSFWGGRTFSPASPLTFDNYARFFANQTYIKLAGTTVKLTQKAGVDGRLFGSVTNFDIAEELKKAGYPVAKAQVRMPQGPIKHVGDSTVSVALHTDVVVDINVTVYGETA